MNELLSVYDMLVVQKLVSQQPRLNPEYMEVRHYHKNVNISTVSLTVYISSSLCLELCSSSSALL